MDNNANKNKNQGKTNDSEKIKIVDKVHIDVDQDQNKDFKVKLTNKRGWGENITTWIAILSFILSIATVLFTYWIHRDDIKNWGKINLARISVVKVNYITFRNITFKELLDTDWGYTPQAQGEPQLDTYNPNMASIKNSLSAKDTISGSYIPNTTSIKVKDLLQELKNKHYSELGRYLIEERFQPMITIQNVGLTSCNIDSIIIKDFMVDTVNYKNLGLTTQTLIEKNFTLEPGQKFPSGKYTFRLPLNAPIPNIQFDYEIYFENINHEKKTKKFRIFGGSDDFVVRNLDEFK